MNITTEDIYRAKDHFSLFVERDFRKYQCEAIGFAMNSDKKVVVIEAPTGSGKSLIGAICSYLYNDSIYLVHSKPLQEQIKEEFPEFKLLFGRSNYPCLKHPALNAGECPYKKASESCEYFDNCPYKVQKRIVSSHPLRVLNYQYILSEWNYVGSLSGKPLVIADEADKFEEVLLGFISLQVSDWHINKFKLPRPKYKTTSDNAINSWTSWSRECSLIVREYMESIPEETPQKEIEQYQGLLQKFNRFSSLIDNTWIYEESSNRYGEYWKFAPTWITPEMTDMYFRNHIGNDESPGKLILLSATLPPVAVLSKEIGIPVSEIDYMEMPSTFNPENRKTYVWPVLYVNKETTEHDFKINMNEKIIDILKKHKDEKGLIHTFNYKIANWVMDIGADRLITHNGSDRQESLDMFKDSSEPLVMVSPSMDRGVSLNDDLARFIIICKMPFPYLGDKQVSTRFWSGGPIGKFWYKSVAIQTIEQMCGRGVRTPDDYCTIYLLDAYIQDSIANNRNLYSKYFIECITM